MGDYNDIQTGVYVSPDLPPVVLEQIEEVVRFRCARDGGAGKHGLVGPLQAFLERNGYRWDPGSALWRWAV